MLFPTQLFVILLYSDTNEILFFINWAVRNVYEHYFMDIVFVSINPSDYDWVWQHSLKGKKGNGFVAYT